LLLQRQHTLLKDLLGVEQRLLLVTGHYTQGEKEHATGFQDFIALISRCCWWHNFFTEPRQPLPYSAHLAPQTATALPHFYLFLP
jgi:hypothetical protein